MKHFESCGMPCRFGKSTENRTFLYLSGIYNSTVPWCWFYMLVPYQFDQLQLAFLMCENSFKSRYEPWLKCFYCALLFSFVLSTCEVILGRDNHKETGHQHIWWRDLQKAAALTTKWREEVVSKTMYMRGEQWLLWLSTTKLTWIILCTYYPRMICR